LGVIVQNARRGISEVKRFLKIQDKFCHLNLNSNWVKSYSTRLQMSSQFALNLPHNLSIKRNETGGQGICYGDTAAKAYLAVGNIIALHHFAQVNFKQ
jgi:hypothetical protein